MFESLGSSVRVSAGKCLPGLRHRWMRKNDWEIVDSLRDRGVHVTHIDRLNIDDVDALVPSAGSLMQEIRRNRPAAIKSFMLVTSPQQIGRFPDLFRWGLNERLLAIVENYIEKPVFYRGVVGRRDLADEQKTGTRLWHRDAEDRRIVKIIVYLSEVTDQGGGFEFVLRSRCPDDSVLQFEDGRVSDEQMARHVPPDGRVLCTGPVGTVVFADTCSVFHRGTVPATRDRETLFYCYNSRNPLKPEFCGPLADQATITIVEPSLSPKQRRCLQVP